MIAAFPPTSIAHVSRPHGGFFAHHGIWAPGVRLFRQLSFAAKALILSLAFLLPLLGLLGWQFQTQASDALQSRQDATRQHVEIAHGILAAAQAQEVAGKLTREQAQQLARQTISGLRYDGKEYFWINDLQPRMVMHPAKPELDGQDVGGIKDPNGLALFQAFADPCASRARVSWPTSGPSPAANSRWTRSPT
jgi:methyl-accepting chemotaxis protein